MLAGADQGVPFLFVAFLWASKEKRPRVQGRSHPQLAVEIARLARDTITKKAAEAAFAKQKIEIRLISESAPDISAAIPLWTPDDSHRE